jgi:hypothetical protein
MPKLTQCYSFSIAFCQLLSTTNADVTSLSPIFAFSLGLTGRVLIRLLDLASSSITSSNPSSQLFTPGMQLDATQGASFEQIQEIFNNYNGAFTPSYSFPTHSAQMAGLGGATNTEWEKALQNEVDLIFIFLCKYGRIWPLASE